MMFGANGESRSIEAGSYGGPTDMTGMMVGANSESRSIGVGSGLPGLGSMYNKSSISQDAQMSQLTLPSSTPPAHSNSPGQLISSTPFSGQDSIPETPMSEQSQSGGSEVIVSAINQLKESFEAKPPAGTEEMQELIAAVNNIEEAYKASIPEAPDDPPSGGNEDGSIVQITEALKSLPAELKAQLQEVTFSHAITGDVRFNFNTEAMASSLGPALTGKLTEMLKEPMILDMLAKSLKGRIDKNGLLGN